MRKRLDVLLVERGLFESRERAQRAILAGLVHHDGRQVDKPGQLVDGEGRLEVRGGQPYVSRGGEKLAFALSAFELRVDGKTCLDIGASTGGFTDCLLQHGAARVFAVDVGRGQLAWRLRQDPRVVVLEGVNARHLRPGDLPARPDLLTVDVSFISLGLILPPALRILDREGDAIALIKPQFEAGREKVGKHGVVRRPEVHREVIAKVLESARGLGMRLCGLTHSPLLGPRGNIEFLAWWARGEESAIDGGRIEEVVAAAHAALLNPV
ncbi:MAG: TlyA family RNA methyltransferase [Patescibacteria group bacterium]